MTADEPRCRCIICHDYGDRAELDDIDRNTIRHVREHGWSVLMIPEDDSGPGWAFTVGLWHTLGVAEVAMFGLGNLDSMRSCLNLLGSRIREGHAVTVGEERHDVVKGYPVVLKPVDQGWYRAFFGTALAFYRRPPLPFLQLVWPDRDGHFPWQRPSEDAPRQPALWLAPDDHPPGVWTAALP